MRVLVKLLIFLYAHFALATNELALRYENISSRELVNADIADKIESKLLRIPLDQIEQQHFDKNGLVTIFLDMPTSLMTNFYLMDEDTVLIKERSFLSGGLNVNRDGPGFIPSITLSSTQLANHNLVVSVEKPKLLSVSFSALPYSEFRSYEGKKISYALIYIGGAIAVGAFILIFGFILKDLSFIYYFLFLFFITPSSADVRGVLNYLSNGAIVYTPFIREISFNLSFAFCLLFTNEYFKVYQNSKKLFYTFLFGIGLFALRSLGLLVIHITELNISLHFLDNSMFHFIFLVVISIYCALFFYKTQKRESIVFLFTWGAFFLFAMIWLMALTGTIAFSFWMNGLIYLGFILQSMILMYGVWQLNHKKEISDLKASESIKLKNLIRVLCHDSINLLNVALAQSEVYKDSDESIETHKEAWNKVNLATKDQMELLSHIREMDALESGKRVLDLVPVKLNELVKKSQVIFEDSLKKKDLRLTLHLGNDVEYIVAERVSLSNNILNNLISNAIKFSHPGSEIVIRTFLKDESVILTIKDSGVGIPQEIVSKLFSPSAKTTRRGTNNESGTGFGMPLVKSTMDAYQAQIEVESRVGDSSGTLFRLVFKKSLSKFQDNSSMEKKNILIIDDDEGIRDICDLWLKSSGLEYTIFSSFKEAREKTSIDGHNICLIDKNLEEEDGLEQAKQYIANNPQSETHFVVMSADITHGQSESIEFFSKPLTKDKLLNFIRNA
jgi:signal transduction histidine kinase